MNYYFNNRFPLEWHILEFFNSFASNVLTVLFYLLSFLGSGEVLFAIIVILYFGINKDLGKKIAFLSIFSVCLNGIFKTFCNARRPFEFEGHENLRKLDVKKDAATGTSFPSGHSENVGCLYTAILLNTKKTWIRIICIACMILIPISRLYLGVHFPGDVVIGLILGIATAILLNLFYNKFHGTKWFYIFSLGAIALFIPSIILNWNIASAKDLFSGIGLYIGCMVSFLVEEKWLPLYEDVPLWKKIIRIVVVAAVAVGVKSGLKLILPDANIFHLLRYLVMTILAFTVVPLFFSKAKKGENNA